MFYKQSILIKYWQNELISINFLLPFSKYHKFIYINFYFKLLYFMGYRLTIFFFFLNPDYYKEDNNIEIITGSSFSEENDRSSSISSLEEKKMSNINIFIRKHRKDKIIKEKNTKI